MTKGKIRIQEAGKGDAALIADISRDSFYEAIGPFNTKENMEKFMNGPFSRDRLIGEVGGETHIFFLAYWEERPVGYVKLKEARPAGKLDNVRAMEIARIYVLQQAIGQGVGNALMQRCLDTARDKDKEVIWLGVWEHNQKAIGFYRRWGFEHFSEHIFMLGNDPQTDWLMKKTLAVT